MRGSRQYIVTFDDETLDGPQRETTISESSLDEVKGVWLSAFAAGPRPYAVARTNGMMQVFRADQSGARFELLPGELSAPPPEPYVPPRLVELPGGGLFVVDGTRGLVVDPGSPVRLIDEVPLPPRVFGAVVAL